MPNVLTTASEVLCDKLTGSNHGGAIATSSSAKLKVNGAAVLLRTGIGSSVSGCKTPSTSSSKPCVSATISGGEASKLTAGGRPVMLDSLKGTTDGVPSGTVPGLAKQDKLTAV